MLALVWLHKMSIFYYPSNSFINTTLAKSSEKELYYFLK